MTIETGIQELINPVGFIWAFLIAAAVYFYRRKEKRAAGAFAFGALVLWVTGSSPLPAFLLHGLEAPYESMARTESADALIVLGGIGSPARTETFRIDLGPAADRAVTGAEMMRQGKAKVLVLGGGKGGGPDQLPTEGIALRDWFMSWRLFTNEVVHLEPSRNTREEASQVGVIAQKRGWHSIMLVTSAAHMKRATAIFEKAGLKVLPIACDFIGTRYYEARDYKIIPRVDGFLLMHLYLHEKLGWWSYRWKQWL